MMRGLMTLTALSFVLHAPGPAMAGQSAAADQAPAAKVAPSTQVTPSAQGNPDEALIRSDVRRVLLDVSVHDPKGGFVKGLTKDDFRVFDDGKQQEIRDFAAGDIPVTVGLIVDESLSMRPKRAEVLTAALSFIHESNPADEMFVLNFNETVRHGLPDTELFSGNISELRNALFAGQPQGRTALYDAIVAGLKQLDMGRQAKKALVLISDGGDNVSTHHLADVMKLTEETSATIYTIGIFDPSDPDKNPDLLKKLAHISGGVSFFPDEQQDLIPICEKIAREIRNRYTLTYVPPDSDKQQVHHVRVEVTGPDSSKLDARTRTTYLYVPETQEALAK